MVRKVEKKVERKVENPGEIILVLENHTKK